MDRVFDVLDDVIGDDEIEAVIAEALESVRIVYDVDVGDRRRIKADGLQVRAFESEQVGACVAIDVADGCSWRDPERCRHRTYLDAMSGQILAREILPLNEHIPPARIEDEIAAALPNTPAADQASHRMGCRTVPQRRKQRGAHRRECTSGVSAPPDDV